MQQGIQDCTVASFPQAADSSTYAVAVQILQPDLDEGVQQQPVASAIYDRHKATLGDTLGRPRLLGAGPGSRVGPDHVFGKPSAREQEPCVGELIRASGGQQQQQVDPGLGASLTRWRNTSETAERVSQACTMDAAGLCRHGSVHGCYCRA